MSEPSWTRLPDPVEPSGLAFCRCSSHPNCDLLRDPEPEPPSLAALGFLMFIQKLCKIVSVCCCFKPLTCGGHLLCSNEN